MASFDSHCFYAGCREKGKGTDPCINNNDCQVCNSLTEEQRIQLSTPSYRLKKEKRDLKKSSDTPNKDSDSSTLIDPSSVTVVGAVDGQGMVQLVHLLRRRNLQLLRRKLQPLNIPSRQRSRSSRLPLTDPQLTQGLMS